MKNMRIGSRLGLGFALVLSLLVLMTIIGVWRLQDIGGRTANMISQDLLKERLASEWAANIDANGVRTVALIKSNNPDHQKYFKDQVAGTVDRTSAIQKQLDELVRSDEGRKIFNALLAQRKVYNDLRNKVFKMKESGDEAGALAALDSELIPAMKEYTVRVNAVASHQRDVINLGAATVDAQYRSGRTILIAVGVIALLVGIIASWRLSDGITRPLQRAVQATAAVAAGDLSKPVVVDRKDEVGQLLQGLHDMTQNLLKTVREVRTGADTIATASSEIATGNLDLSSRTEQQAGSLEETASAIEQLTSTVRQNADNAREANQLALSASDVAVQGGAVVGKVVDTMGAINESSRRIVDIISVIDGIAFQTNILALNAAVEAARAGEQGRGFAVVASEVRNLAQRSASAAKEIKTLIGDSVDKVDSGTRLVEQAGKTMTEVVSSVKRVSDIVAEISAATQEQSTGIGEVNRAITQMDQVTQQNAALVEQAAAAAGSLQEQAARLAQVVSVFRLDNDGMMPAAPMKTIAPQPRPVIAAARAAALPAAKARAPSRPAMAIAAPQTQTPSHKKAPADADNGSEEWETF
ncbi:methyl-accepting chemotaxis protein [Herbaspirillum sp. RV1423]|uniref:methyl-accepting chemotaxis protein n=1 Tax=Herbaspirillum sp. RV1423 TaxID=1443993 RepID=UPI0004ADB155|nr:methyl-accepting chemotaxis protein [Herbaspirillum sp. RV1423]